MARTKSNGTLVLSFLVGVVLTCAGPARVAVAWAGDPEAPKDATSATSTPELSVAATGESLPAPPPTDDTPAQPSTRPDAPPPGVVLLTRSDDVAPTTTVRYTQQRRWGMFAAGIVLFLVGYGTDIGLTYGFGHTPEYTSAIPLVGPFIQMSQSYGLEGPPFNSGDPTYDQKLQAQVDSANSTIRSLVYSGLAGSAVLQLAGATLAIVGVAYKRPMRTYAAAPRVGISLAAGGLRLTW